MRELKQGVIVLGNINQDDVFKLLSNVVGTPYAKDYDVEKTKKVITTCVRKGHESVLEHINITLDCLTNVGTYKDYTRHRHCAFTIESTSFVKYDDLPVIIASDMDDITKTFIRHCENVYKSVSNPKVGRDYLPQCLAARMIMTTNIREWRHIIGLRGDPNDNPLTNELRDLIWRALHTVLPFFFPFDTDDVSEVMKIKQLWK